jgi:hypothetical protein
MKKMLPVTSLLLLLSVVASLESCDLFEKGQKPRTELEKLPPETQEGKNTFGCLVDGKAWVIKTSIDAQAFYQEGVFSMSAEVISSGIDPGIGFVLLESDLQEISYSLTFPSERFAQFDDAIINCVFQTFNNSGTLTIKKLDKLNFIISGTFEFDAYSSDCDKIVKITHGRFDLNYAP